MTAAVLTLLVAQVTVRFDPSSPQVGPFPTDVLTVADTSQKTGRRVNLPAPDCAGDRATCDEIAELNQLDGFSLNPRLTVQFSGGINIETLAAGLLVMALENLTHDETGLHRVGATIAVNQLVFDPETNTVYAKPDSILDQHRRYVFVVTDAVRSIEGAPAAADPAFTACITGPPSDYCRAMAAAVASLAPRRIVGASLFTTLSATAWMEKARVQVARTPLSVALTRPVSTITLAGVAGFVWRRQVRTDPLAYEETLLPLQTLPGLRQIVFGSFRAPSFLDSKQLIPTTPTAADLAPPAAAHDIYFHVYLPLLPKPASGYPVAIFAHGLGDTRFLGPSLMASVFAASGIATIAIDAVGHGYGPLSKMLVEMKDGTVVQVPAGGRGVDLDGNGTIDNLEGCLQFTGVALGLRDCLRQTALDHVQLLRVLRTGLDLDGDAKADLDSARVYFAGQSLGGMVGTMLAAIEPDLPLVALNSTGASVVDIGRFSQTLRVLAIAPLFFRNPSLLNGDVDFEDNYPLRNQPVRYNTVAGAIEIQNYFERIEWLDMPGDPLAFAPHLAASTLPGVAAKQVLWQFGWGDRTIPNPSASALIRAAGMRESTWLYRHDVVRAVLPQLPADPHSYLTGFGPLSVPVQQQVAQFFLLNGAPRDPNIGVREFFGRDIFEIPASLPDALNY